MKKLFETFAAAGKELFLVGGAVRDLALGMTLDDLDDLDFCTNARPPETLKILRDADFATYDMGFEFGTVGAVLYGPEEKGFPKDVQITTYRSKEYYRRTSRHPQVEFGDTIDQDLWRRDFSINSIAMDAEGNYIDPYDGLGDLKRGILRVVGDPSETLAEDPLRILRIARFKSRLGFDVHPELHAAAVERAEKILDISAERWLQETTKLLKGEYVADALDFLVEVGVLELLLPEVTALVWLHESSPVHHKDVWAHTLQVVQQCPLDPVLRWAGLLHDIGKATTREVTDDGNVTFYGHERAGAEAFDAIALRFTMDKATAKAVRHIIEHHGRISQYDEAWTDAAVRRFVREMDPYVDEIIAFGRADLTTRFEEKRAAALARVDELEQRIAALQAEESLRPELPSGIGNVLIEAFDLAPGPIIGDLKDYLDDEIIEGRLASGCDAPYYVEYIRQNPPDGWTPPGDDA
jgi:poly(A) polymerase